MVRIARITYQLAAVNDGPKPVRDGLRRITTWRE